MSSRELSKQHGYTSRGLTTTCGNDAIYCLNDIPESSSSGELRAMECFGITNVIYTTQPTTFCWSILHNTKHLTYVFWHVNVFWANGEITKDLHKELICYICLAKVHLKENNNRLSLCFSCFFIRKYTLLLWKFTIPPVKQTCQSMCVYLKQ